MSDSDSDSDTSSSSSSSSSSSTSSSSSSSSASAEKGNVAAKTKSKNKVAKTTKTKTKTTDDSHQRPSKRSRVEDEKQPTKTTSGPSSAPPLEIVETDETRRANGKEPPPVIVLLDRASLETVKTRRGTFELLNCDDHRDLCRKHKRNPADHRPDICHQELLALIDSPLNKAGRLRVFVRTTRNVLIEVHPSLRVPRTYKRFAGLMVQLLHKMKIKAESGGGGGNAALLRVVKGPFSRHLPPGTIAYGMSAKGELHSPAALARVAFPTTTTSTSAPVCFVVGAMAAGSIDVADHPYVERVVSVSEYPLSGAAALSRLLGGVEQHWGIV